MSSPEILEKLAAFVPMPVALNIHRLPRPLTRPIARRFQAAALFADVSGFTPLTERLSQSGVGGAEELSDLINPYFSRMIQIVRAYHGQVVKFSGDALTVIFPVETLPFEQARMQTAIRLAAECGLAMQAAMYDFSDLKTSHGRVFLSMKVGLGAGEVLECSIGGSLQRWEYVVGGDPIVQVAVAEEVALPGQVIVHQRVWARIEPFFQARECTNRRGFVELQGVQAPLAIPGPQTQLEWASLSQQDQARAEEALQCYVPGAIKARLEQQEAWLSELRRMTILFVGVGGLDYEAANIAQRLQNLIQATQEVVYHFEGSLGKITVDDKGTVILILFGAPPFSHEDDATRAVACALSLQTIAREQTLKLAIGITEGAVFAGPVGAADRREYTVIGDEVNLAARLMQAGAAGDIFISERVRDRAGPRFITESRGEMSIKGKASAVRAYQVNGEEGVQDEIVNRYLLHEEPMVGRKAELERLRRTANRARRGQRQLLFIEGELGLGKSRLAAEMVREWIMAGGAAYGGRCISYGKQILYQGWREVLAGIFGLTRALSPERQVVRLEAGLSELPVSNDQPGYWVDRLPLLADLLGLDVPDNSFTKHLSSELRRNNIFELVENILRHQAGRHNLLILIEDIHWADELSLALVSHLAYNLLDCPLLLALVHRPLTEADLGPLASAQGLADTTRIDLQPLSVEESDALIQRLLTYLPQSPEVRKVLLRRGQGNPFFIQEIASAIREAMRGRQEVRLDMLDDLDLPDSVQDVILSRIDRLSDDEKLTLKIASVLGTSFQRLVLSRIHPMQDASVALPGQLDHLETEQLLRLEAPAPRWEYVFRNVIAQEVMYEGLLLAQRRHLHGVVGEVLEILTPGELEQLAFHYARSDHWQKALDYLNQAGQKSVREFANHAAIGYYSDILTCLTNRAAENGRSIISEPYWDAVLERARLYNLIGRRDEELEDLGTLGIMAEALDDDYRRALAARQWATLYETSGDYDSGLEMIQRCVAIAEKVGDDRLIGEGCNQWGKLLYLRGRYEPAAAYLARAWEIAQQMGDHALQADCLNNRGIVAYYQADYEQAQGFFQQAIDLCQASGNQLGLGDSLCHLGQVHYDLGRYSESKSCYDSGSHFAPGRRKSGWRGAGPA